MLHEIHILKQDKLLSNDGSLETPDTEESNCTGTFGFLQRGKQSIESEITSGTPSAMFRRMMDGMRGVACDVAGGRLAVAFCRVRCRVGRFSEAPTQQPVEHTT